MSMYIKQSKQSLNYRPLAHGFRECIAIGEGLHIVVMYRLLIIIIMVSRVWVIMAYMMKGVMG